MLKMKISACIETSPDKTWSVLSDIENISDWAEPVLSATSTGPVKNGIGAERFCELKGGITIREKWVEWEEGNYFTYIGYGLPLVKSAKNKWSVQSSNEKTVLVSESEVELKGGMWGRLLEPLMKIVSKRMASESLAAFKYLVENGCPYKGSFSSLPRVPLIC